MAAAAAAATPKYPPIALAMLQVAAWVATNGIDKDKESKAEGKYKYRGIDKVLNELSMPLADAGLTVAPSFRLVNQVDYKGKGVISQVECSICFWDAHGEHRTVGPVLGEAFDGMDKSFSKAQSVAYRNLMLLTFVAPLGPLSPNGDDHDPESADEPKQDFPADEEIAPEDRGIKLEGGQLKWLRQKMQAANVSEAELLTRYPRVDKSNAREVGGWLDNG